jgi:hypothetical protein
MAPSTSHLSAAGVFANGVRATAVVQMVLDYDEEARLEDIAAYFGLAVGEVVAALAYCARRAKRLQGDERRAR